MPQRIKALIGFVLLFCVSGVGLESTGAADYGSLPLSFVPNAGQTRSGVNYVAEGPGVGVFFTPQQVRFAFAKGDRGHALALSFVNAQSERPPVARQQLQGRVNYLRGSNPTGHHVGLPTYSELVYRELWRGIDMAFRGGQGHLKYEFRLRPGARVEDIRLSYQGAERLSVDADGTLLIDTSIGALRDDAPTAYQIVGGVRIAVPVRYEVDRESSAYGFAIDDDYSRAHALVIDPSIDYSTFLGGAADDEGFDIDVHPNGEAYVTGSTQGTGFPTTPGAYDVTHNGGDDVFVTKFNKTGTALVYSTYIGGSSSDIGESIAVLPNGEAYVTGETRSSNFPATPGAFDDSLNGGEDVFVLKLNKAGSALVYSTFLGGTANEQGRGIAVDHHGNAHVGGLTSSIDFPTTPGSFDPNYNGGTSDGFVTKLNDDGSDLLYSTFLGGELDDVARAIALDRHGHAYATGYTRSVATFPVTPGAYDTTRNSPPTRDPFVTKFTEDGSALVYSTFLGGMFADEGAGIAVDPRGEAYVTGYTNSPNYPTTVGAAQPVPGGVLGSMLDAFITKLNDEGSALVYSTFLGGLATEEGRDITVDRRDRAHVTGFTNSLADFPRTLDAVQPVYGGGLADAFQTTVNAEGSAFVHSTFLGGELNDRGRGIAVDPVGDPYVTGWTASLGFPTEDAYDASHNGARDVFVTKYDLRR